MLSLHHKLVATRVHEMLASFFTSIYIEQCSAFLCVTNFVVYFILKNMLNAYMCAWMPVAMAGKTVCCLVNAFHT